jgi:lycopene beta-cyclase
MPTNTPNQPALLIVGGGLAGALLALAMAKYRPDVPVELVDGGDSFGGNHIWSVFASDLDAEGHALIAPLVACRWDGYDIAFPARRRTLSTGYASITSERLDAEVRRVLGDRARTGVRVAALTPTAARLDGGGALAAGVVVDARGPGPEIAHYDCGWQKFVGQELVLDAPHGLERPVVMDATVDQIDGYRFVYLLPFGPDRIFVEDTYYSDTPEVDRNAIAGRIADYAAQKGWRVIGVEREERGSLPVIIGGDFDAIWPVGDAVARLGVRAGMFHPTTGYSLPSAVASAITIAKGWPNADLAGVTRSLAKAKWQSGGFYRMLDTMLYRAAAPDQRYRVLEHFYRLPEPLVERFYAGQSTWHDRMKLLSGRPPVPIAAAMRAILRRK